MPLWKPLKFEKAEDAATGALILRLEGALTESPESYAFLENVRAELQEKPRDVVMNLAKVNAMTSSGVGVIAAIHSSATSRGKQMAITTLTPRVQALVNLIHLDMLVSVLETEAAALSEIASKRPVG